MARLKRRKKTSNVEQNFVQSVLFIQYWVNSAERIVAKNIGRPLFVAPESDAVPCKVCRRSLRDYHCLVSEWWMRWRSRCGRYGMVLAPAPGVARDWHASLWVVLEDTCSVPTANSDSTSARSAPRLSTSRPTRRSIGCCNYYRNAVGTWVARRSTIASFVWKNTRPDAVTDAPGVSSAVCWSGRRTCTITARSSTLIYTCLYRRRSVSWTCLRMRLHSACWARAARYSG